MAVAMVLSVKRTVRRGETLIEIMASIMVLSIGLVGVLAAIPFGGFRMSQMTEADNSAAVGRNAVRTIRINGWADPNSWWIKNPQNSSYVSNADPLLYHDGIDGFNYLNATVPFVFDPLSVINSIDYYPRKSLLSPDDGYGTRYVFVSPLPQSPDGSRWVPQPVERLKEWYNGLFFQQDDLISGYSSTEDESEFRPRVGQELGYPEYKTLLDNSTAPETSFSGRCSWMAFVYPKPRGGVPADKCNFSDIVSADFDAVVFHDRIIGEEMAFAATVEDSGYRGGVVSIELSSCRDYKNDRQEVDYEQISEQLTRTRYIMLVGADDNPITDSAGNSVVPSFSRWYKIANFAGEDKDNDKVIDHVRLTLIGENTPFRWTPDAPVEERSPVTAVLYPGVIGVYSGSTAMDRSGF